ncbi:hypothetical protein KRM28CT15_28030 [Krasilnikovia sp. M28-CT-15]
MGRTGTHLSRAGPVWFEVAVARPLAVNVSRDPAEAAVGGPAPMPVMATSMAAIVVLHLEALMATPVTA